MPPSEKREKQTLAVGRQSMPPLNALVVFDSTARSGVSLAQFWARPHPKRRSADWQAGSLHWKQKLFNRLPVGVRFTDCYQESRAPEVSRLLEQSDAVTNPACGHGLGRDKSRSPCSRGIADQWIPYRE